MESDSQKAWLRRARALLDEDFSEPWTLTSLSRVVGVHRAHLAREFQRAYGCSVGVYLRRRRLAYVCQALAHSTLSVRDVAAAAGFADQSHLTKLFKQSFGLTPLAYRRFHAASQSTH